MMKNSLAGFALGVMISTILTARAGAAAPPTTAASDAADVMTLKNVKIEGTLDLENGVPIRWKKPDGSGYVNIFMLDKNGTLQLCHDPYYWDANASDVEHGRVRVIEVRNPNSNYPDFRLPVTRNNKQPAPKRETVNADSKLQLRSASFVETNDPSELNLIRTGTDDPNRPDDEGPTGEGTVSGLIRWMSKKDQITTDAEMIARSYGFGKEHYGAVIIQPVDARFPDFKWSPMLVMKRGVRLGGVRGMKSGVVGAALEVDSMDDRPVILRRPGASTTQPVTLAFAGGTEGTQADQSNTLGLIKATNVAANANAPISRVEIQTNKGNQLETSLILPVPAAQVTHGGGQKIPSGERVALWFDQESYDSDTMHDAAKEPTRLTCRTAGRYMVSASVEFSANGKGSREVIVRRNGRDQVAAMRVPAVDGETTKITFTSPPVGLEPGNYVELIVRQTSGMILEVPAKPEMPLAFSMTRAG
jgi:hypothetical protein